MGTGTGRQKRLDALRNSVERNGYPSPSQVANLARRYGVHVNTIRKDIKTLKADGTEKQGAERKAADDYPTDPAEYRKALLVDIRAVRVDATGVAYASLVKQERELLDQVAADRAAKQAEEDKKTEDDVVSEFRADWHQLPQRMKDRIRAIVNG